MGREPGAAASEGRIGIVARRLAVLLVVAWAAPAEATDPCEPHASTCADGKAAPKRRKAKKADAKRAEQSRTSNSATQAKRSPPSRRAGARAAGRPGAVAERARVEDDLDDDELESGPLDEASFVSAKGGRRGEGSDAPPAVQTKPPTSRSSTVGKSLGEVPATRKRPPGPHTGDADDKADDAFDGVERDHEDADGRAREPGLPGGPTVREPAPTRSEVTDDVIDRLVDGTVLHRRKGRMYRRKGEITIDGVDDDAGWKRVPETAADFQLQPTPGGAPTGASYFRIAYDDGDLYAFVRVVDPEPDKIRALLHRGDLTSKLRNSDWISLGLDPTLNRRAGYIFQVNARGVKIDWRTVDDNVFDPTYDAVWDAKARPTPDGYAIEYRIPLSQLRTATASAYWGVNILRRIARTQEWQVWSPYTRTSGRFTSAYGDVYLEDPLHPRRNVELRPYLLAGLDRRSQAVAELRGVNEPTTEAGLDLSARLGPLSITSVVNPDFGQVEADPSRINLTNKEEFLEEKRPFFQKDSEIFGYRLSGEGETLFYSRRIGAPPHGEVRGVAVDQPDDARILGAAKLTGEWGSEASIGALSVLTAEERARGLQEDGSITTAVVEPLSSFNALSVSKRLGAGTELRGFGAAVVRRLDGTGLEAALSRRATTGGVRFVSRSEAWELGGSVEGSHVEGSPEAIGRLQRARQRYYQRPDAEHLEVDDTRTSLSGVGGSLSASTFGSHAFKAALRAVTPGFESNDLGLLRRADLVAGALTYSYDGSGGAMLVNQWAATPSVTTDTQGTPLDARLDLTGLLETPRAAVLRVYGAIDRPMLDTGYLRGGPALARDDNVLVGLDYTARPGTVQLLTRAEAFYVPASSSRYVSGSVGAVVQVGDSASISLEPSYTLNVDDEQYVGEAAPMTGGVEYLVAHLRQHTFSAQLRASWQLRANLDLDAYVQPFVSSGAYVDYRAVAAPRAAQYTDRYRSIGVTRQADGLALDLDGNGGADATIDENDFTISEYVSNVVLRWEYRLGSTLYVVWSHKNAAALPLYQRFPDSADLLRQGENEDVVLIKASYWWNPSF